VLIAGAGIADHAELERVGFVGQRDLIQREHARRQHQAQRRDRKVKTAIRCH
jgi:hypothetical protein